MTAWIKQHGPVLLVQLFASVIVGAFSSVIAIKVLAVRIEYAERGVDEAKTCCQLVNERVDHFFLRGGP